MEQSPASEIRPSVSTGVYDLPTDRKDRILAYVGALIEAKSAGVAGEAVHHMQGFVDQVTRQRVSDAGVDARWPGRLREMESDEAAWLTRIGDRAPRALAKMTDAAPTAAATVRLLREARNLTSEQRQQLADCWDEAVTRDIERVEELLPSIVQPTFASLRRRAFDVVREVPKYDEFHQVAQNQSSAVYAAAAASFAGDRLPPSLRAILHGPWAAIVDDDPTELAGAWTDEADDLRADFTNLDSDAWRDPSESF
jgi:folylpolyglutamate synthase/dihydropteroate synthase